MQRPSHDEYFLRMAILCSTRSTCIRNNVGCILVDKRKYVLATGYNGVAVGQPHCIDYPCNGAKLKSGEGLDKCLAIHAEQNALLQCRYTDHITAAYITHSPCIHCAKLFSNTKIQKIIYHKLYDAKAISYLEESGIKCHLMNLLA
jgi:dCMP deaminase